MSKQVITTNEMLMLGIGVLIIGIVLAAYSFSSYKEIKSLETQFDFETLDKNNGISTSDKYYKYLEYADLLIQKLKVNKNIPIKNVSCVYLDYARHNAVQLYYITDRKMTFDSEKKSTALSNIRALYNILDDYKTCSQVPAYKTELEDILNGVNNSDKEKLRAEERMNEFIYGRGVKAPKLSPGTEETDTEETLPQNFENTASVSSQSQEPEPNYIDDSGHAQTLTPEQIDYINKQQAQGSAQSAMPQQ